MVVLVFSLPLCLTGGWFCKEKLHSGHSCKLKGGVVHSLICITFPLQLKEGEDLISTTESKNLGHFFLSKTRKYNAAWCFSTSAKKSKLQ